MRLGPDEVRVVHARVATHRRDEARLRLERRAAAVEWMPPGLPPAAILCVRSLKAPPVGLHDPDARAWGLAVRAALADSLARAARPEDAPDADVVLFESEAHLLAVLARHGAAGRASWWWAALFGSRGMPERWPELWSERAGVVPYAMARMVREGSWPVVAAGTTDAVAIALAEAVTFVWGLRGVRQALIETRAFARSHALPAPAPEAWEDIAPWLPAPIRSHGSPAGQVLAAIALGVVTEPATVRGAEWAQRLAAALSGPSDADDPAPAASLAPELPEGPRGTAPRAGRAALRLVQDGLPAAAEPTPPANATAPASVGDAPADDDPAAPYEAAGPAGRRAEVSSPPLRLAPPEPRTADGSAQEPTPPISPEERPAQVVPGSASGRPTPPTEGDPPEPSAPDAHPEAARPERPRPRPLPFAAFPPLAFETRFGGVFYLLNVALALDLYGDFSRPLQPGVALAPWAWTEGIARRILGEIPDDPLWGWLAARVTEPRGEAPARWTVPAAWLAAFGPAEAPWRWDRIGGRLIVEHPDGFVVFAGDSAEDAAAVTGPHRPELVRAGLLDRYDGTWTAWLDHCASYVACRLARAVPGRTPASVLAQPGRVVDALERVDVQFDLAAHPVGVRAAGLDRDPGWIPAAGVDVRFCFEGGVVW